MSTGTSKKNFDSFKSFLRILLKSKHKNMGFQSEAILTFDNFISALIDRCMEACLGLLEIKGEKTISPRTVIAGFRLILPGELAKKSVDEALRAINTYQTSFLESSSKKEKRSESVRADLVLPVTRIRERWMRPKSCDNAIGKGAPVAMTATVEYIVKELIELASNSAMKDDKVTINNRHITLALQQDLEFKELTRDMIFAGGVLPHIHESLTK
jgi:histone H3/H4